MNQVHHCDCKSQRDEHRTYEHRRRMDHPPIRSCRPRNSDRRIRGKCDCHRDDCNHDRQDKKSNLFVAAPITEPQRGDRHQPRSEISPILPTAECGELITAPRIPKPIEQIQRMRDDGEHYQARCHPWRPTTQPITGPAKPRELGDEREDVGNEKAGFVRHGFSFNPPPQPTKNLVPTYPHEVLQNVQDDYCVSYPGSPRRESNSR